MTWLLGIALSNLAVGLIFAICALVAMRLARPALAHGLWLLFFIKLLTPPLFHVTISWVLAPSVQDVPANERTIVVAPVADLGADEKQAQLPAAPPTNDVEDASVLAQDLPSAAPRVNQPRIMTPASQDEKDVADSSMPLPWAEMCIGLWLAGSCAWFCLAGLRLARFRKQLSFARPAPPDLQEEVARLANLMKVTCPETCVLPGPLSPMLWVFGRKPRLLIPDGLLARLGATQRQAVVAHELAHWKRRDHWVRRLELVVLSLYWWCPLVWWARRHLQETEEECCDAWVVWLLPGAARGYALALLETVEFMSSARIQLPPVASGIGHVRLLKRRLTMIMRGTTPRSLTLGGGLALLALGALLLPLIPTWAQPPVSGQPGGDGQDRAALEAREKLRALKQAGLELKQMQHDIEVMQQELQARRAELDAKAAELNRRMDQLKRAAVEANRNAERKSGEPQPGSNNPFGGGGGFGGSMPGMAGGPGGMGGGFGVTGNLADVERRLRQLENKIDMLIQLMRRDGPGAAPSPSNRRTPSATGEGSKDNAPAPSRRSGGIRAGGGASVGPENSTLPTAPADGPGRP